MCACSAPAGEPVEHGLLEYATSAMQSVRGLHIVGTAPNKASVLSFVIDGHDPVEIGKALDREGIAVRAGHHCAKPAHARFGVQSSTRMSSYLYTTPTEIDALVDGLEYTRSYFKLG